jgi:hypothetical protein
MKRTSILLTVFLSVFFVSCSSVNPVYRTHSFSPVTDKEIAMLKDPSKTVVFDLGDSTMVGRDIEVHDSILTASLSTLDQQGIGFDKPNFKKGIHALKPGHKNELQSLVYVFCFWRVAPEDHRLNLKLSDIIQIQTYNYDRLMSGASATLTILGAVIVIGAVVFIKIAPYLLF